MPYRVVFAISILISVLANSSAHALLNARSIEQAWDSQPGFSETRVLSISEGNRQGDDIPLTLVVYKNSGWTVQEVSEKWARTVQIYSQCRIRFNPVLILSTRNAAGPIVNKDLPHSHFAPPTIENGVGMFKPVVYFAAAESENRNYGGYSWRRSDLSARTDAQKRNSVFIYRSYAIDADRSAPLEIPGSEGRYEVLAHELAHVLMDLPHLDTDGHIMSNMNYRTNVILPSQCRAIRRNLLNF